jgi:hypothetical protein
MPPKQTQEQLDREILAQWQATHQDLLNDPDFQERIRIGQEHYAKYANNNC